MFSTAIIAGAWSVEAPFFARGAAAEERFVDLDDIGE
jgi:hypothetical protein